MVLTAYHVVQGADEITVEFPDGSKAPGVMLGRDLGRDLAIVSVERDGLRAVPFADADALSIGQTLIKLGYGAGQQGAPAVTQGIISALLEPTRTDPALVQTDSAVNPGDSGSPLITGGGRIAAIATAKLVAVQIEGVSFGTLMESGDALVHRMIEGETVCQPQPTLTDEATDPEWTYRNNDWGWFAQLPSGYNYYNVDGFAAFYRDGAYRYPLNVRSRWPVDVIVYNPWLKTSYANAEGLVDAVLGYWASDDGLGYEIYRRGGVREVCRGSEIAWEQDFTLVNPRTVGGFTERNRFMVVDGGSLWYLLRVATWPDRFERYQEETDTILYTFRFNRTPLSP